MVYHGEVAEATKMGVAVEEVTATRIIEDDVVRKSAEAR